MEKGTVPMVYNNVFTMERINLSSFIKAVKLSNPMNSALDTPSHFVKETPKEIKAGSE